MQYKCEMMDTVVDKEILHSVTYHNGNGGATPVDLSWTAIDDTKAHVFFYGFVTAIQTGSDTSQKHSATFTVKVNDEVVKTETLTQGIYMYNSNGIAFEFDENIDFKAGDVLNLVVTHSGYGITNVAHYGYVLRIEKPQTK